MKQPADCGEALSKRQAPTQWNFEIFSRNWALPYELHISISRSMDSGSSIVVVPQPSGTKSAEPCNESWRDHQTRSMLRSGPPTLVISRVMESTKSKAWSHHIPCSADGGFQENPLPPASRRLHDALPCSGEKRRDAQYDDMNSYFASFSNSSLEALS